MRPRDSDPTRYTPGSYDHEFDTPLDDSIFDEALPLASPWVRLAAVLLNGLMFFGACLPGGLLLGIGEETGSDALIAGGVVLLIGLAGGLVVYQAVLLSREGQSIGKRIFKIRIVDASDESNPGFARVLLLRYLAVGCIASIPVIGALFSLADAFMVFSEENKTIHDRMASTVVVTEQGLY